MPRPKKSNRADGRYEIKRTIAVTSNGDAIRKSFYGADKAEAENAYRAFVEGQERNERKKKNMPFEEWVDKWLYVYKEPDVKTTTFMSTYERPCKLHIIPYFKDAFIQDVTQADVKEFINSKSSMSESALEKFMICLRGIFETAIDNDLLAKNPCRNVSVRSKAVKRQKRTYDRETVEAICSSDHPYAIYPHILLRMGLRCSEMCGLRWEDVDLERGILHVRQARVAEGSLIVVGVPKSKTSVRHLPIPDDLAQRLKSEREENPDNDLVATFNGKPLNPNRLSEGHLQTFYRAIGVPDELQLSTHELRHTCGTLLYQATKDIYHVSKFLGHSDIGITSKTYVHSDLLEEAVHVDFSRAKI